MLSPGNGGGSRRKNPESIKMKKSNPKAFERNRTLAKENVPAKESA
jgi:hypothetical protein